MGKRDPLRAFFRDLDKAPAVGTGFLQDVSRHLVGYEFLVKAAKALLTGKRLKLPNTHTNEQIRLHIYHAAGFANQYSSQFQTAFGSVPMTRMPLGRTWAKTQEEFDLCELVCGPTRALMAKHSKLIYPAVGVTTSPITLTLPYKEEHLFGPPVIQLGQFEIIIPMKLPGRPLGCGIMVRPLTPNYPAGKGRFCPHPNANGALGKMRLAVLCTGEGESTIYKALDQNRWSQAASQAEAVLRTNGNESPYYQLYKWYCNRLYICPRCQTPTEIIITCECACECDGGYKQVCPHCPKEATVFCKCGRHAACHECEKLRAVCGYCSTKPALAWVETTLFKEYEAQRLKDNPPKEKCNGLDNQPTGLSQAEVAARQNEPDGVRSVRCRRRPR